MKHPTFKFLLADDDKDDCDLFFDALSELSLPVECDTVRDGEELMDYLRKNNSPDLIFLDINMPRKNGLECLEEIKKDPTLSSIPVIILSSGDEKSVVEALNKLGADQFIPKPNAFSSLKMAIRQVFFQSLSPSLA